MAGSNEWGVRCCVKVLIKNLKTGLFVDREGGWTNKPHKVRDFETPAAVQGFRDQHYEYHGIVTVIRFKDPRHDIELRNHRS